MRWIGAGAVVFLAGLATAQTPQTIVEAAIRAQSGSPAQQAKLSRRVQSSKGTIEQFGIPHPATREFKLQLPSEGRFAFEIDPTARKATVVLAASGFRGWRSVGGVASDLPSADTDALLEDLHAMHLATLTPLQGRGVQLALQPDTVVAGKPAKVIRVSSGLRPDVLLAFDASNSLLVRVAFRGTEAGVQVNKEMVFESYRAFGSVQMPGKETVYHDGKRIAEWTLQACEFPESFPPGAFAKPAS